MVHQKFRLPIHCRRANSVAANLFRTGKVVPLWNRIFKKLSNFLTISFVVISFIFLFCDREPQQPSSEDKILLFEIKRITSGTCVDEKCTSINIDFGAYYLKSDTVHVIIADDSLNTATKMACAFDRSLSGDVGGGKSGKVSFIQEMPKSIEIIKYPLATEADSLTILSADERGNVNLIYKNKKYTCQTKSTVMEVSNGIMDITTGRFLIADTLKFINHGFINKNKIIVY